MKDAFGLLFIILMVLATIGFAAGITIYIRSYDIEDKLETKRFGLYCVYMSYGAGLLAALFRYLSTIDLAKAIENGYKIIRGFANWF